VIKDKIGTKAQRFSYKNGLNFSEKVGIFPKIGVSPKQSLNFLRGALEVAFP